jgi:hypothetical protein
MFVQLKIKVVPICLEEEDNYPEKERPLSESSSRLACSWHFLIDMKRIGLRLNCRRANFINTTTGHTQPKMRKFYLMKMTLE